MPSAAAASSPGHPPRAGVLGAAGVPLSFSTAVAPPLKGPGREGVRTCFEEILNTALTARWIEQSLERAGERTRAVRARALWAADARHRLEILESVRAGACLVRRGERATVRPPGLFGAIRLSSYERDGPVCSLRGDALDEVGFTAPLRDLLKGRKVARLEPARGGAAIALLSDAGARVRVELSGEPLVNSRIVHARGCARVEWRAFQRVESNPPLAPRECEPLKPPDKKVQGPMEPAYLWRRAQAPCSRARSQGRFPSSFPEGQEDLVPDLDGLAGHPSRSPAIKVLIIEDNRDGADSLRDVLAIYGYEVEVAYDGSDGLARALDFGPDVVICDVGLPDLDGYQVARALRAHRDLGRAMLVALTGYGQPEDQRSAFEAGFNAHMTKPADLESLQRLLADVARGSEIDTAAPVSRTGDRSGT